MMCGPTSSLTKGKWSLLWNLFCTDIRKANSLWTFSCAKELAAYVHGDMSGGSGAAILDYGNHSPLNERALWCNVRPKLNKPRGKQKLKRGLS